MPALLSIAWFPSGLLLALAAMVLVWVVVWWKRSPLTFRQIILLSIKYLVAKLVWRTRIYGELPLAANEGAIIVANHRSSVDPMFIQICVRRVVYWMVAREFVQAPVIGWLLRQFEVISVGRGGVDTAATKLAIRKAQEGGLVGMFPEGRINLAEEPFLLPGRPGAVLVALKARVPIVPVYIEGAPYNGTPHGPLFMLAHVRVFIGQKIDLSQWFGREKEEGVTAEITKLILQEIAALGGRANFEPQLAGRRWRTDADAAAELEENEANGGGNGNGNSIVGADVSKSVL